ncbi:2'-5' RNA ligase family protein [Paraburkholderia tuberum]|nr:2'-5' RNA ligase family protein [Paraburkholderia tuberum]
MRFGASCKLRVPADITVLFPFIPAADIAPAVIHHAQVAFVGRAGAVQPFVGAVGQFIGLRQFPSILFLSPDPPESFVALTTALGRAFPVCSPYDGTHEDSVPHLSVADGDASDVHAASIELKQ